MASPASQAVEFLTPVGRLVGGNLYKARTTDADGKPLLIKSGPNTGQPKTDYYFALAVPKAGEQHWAQTSWGAILWQTGHSAWPGGQAQSPAFAWKISDGDSAIPNKAGNKPCDNEGWPGCWVLHFSSSFAPKIVNKDGTAPITEVDAVKPGYYVQVYGSVASNMSTQTPGVFLNHMAVSMQAFGPEIILSGRVDTTKVGFGQSALPAGASAMPVGGALPAPGTPGAPGIPVMPGMPAAIPAPAAHVPAMPAPVMPAPVAAAPLPVMPNPALMQAAVPGAAMPGVPVMQPPGAPVMQPPAALTPDSRLTPKAGGANYAQLIAAGWTDATLIANGLMV